MANILKIVKDFNPKKALGSIFDKIDEILQVTNENATAIAALPVQPKVYKALLTQTGTNPPEATKLVNTLSGTPSYQYNSNGEFQLNLVGEFPDITKVFLLIGTLGSAGSAQFACNDTDSILINTFNVLGELTDNLLDSTSITIEVYP